MRVPMISAKQLITEHLDASGHEGELDETYVVKCISDGADRVTTHQQLVHMVEVVDVHDYKVSLPPNFKFMQQAACRVGHPVPVAREQISKMTQRVLGTGCEIEISIKCPECHNEPCSCTDRKVIEVDVNRIWETANPQYYAKYMDHFYMHGGNTGRGTRSLYHDDFYLMKVASGNFWNAPYHLNGCLNMRIESEYEYSIQPPSMIVNFKEGEVLIGYMASQTDDDGYLMVPNTPQAIQAIIWYVQERLAFQRYSQTASSKDEKFWSNMMIMREKHIGRAKEELRHFSEDEFWQFVENHWRKMIPYRKFHQNLDRNQADQFMFPDQTTNIEGYISPYHQRRNSRI